ncbi:MAG: LamG-like jellyroll fold domain-containing protein [Bacteroidota bacterium]
MNKLILLSLAFIALSCGKAKQEAVEEVKDPKKELQEQLKSALTLYASFDEGVDANMALGDSKLYTVMDRRQMDSAMIGLHKDSVNQSSDMGKAGSGGLLFTGKTRGSIFYKSEKNIAYDSTNWSGAISFWLKLNPDEDLRPGFCDPIQITDVSYNDASIWVDFTKTLPRAFRLGVIEDRNAWNPNPEGPDNENPIFMDLLVRMDGHPFNRDSWTHVLVNYSGLNSHAGKADLYVNGSLAGTRDSISNPFSWEIEKSNIYIGLSYIGLFDELSLYNRYLTEEEIRALYQDKISFK